jgi:hypothetical protein
MSHREHRREQCGAGLDEATLPGPGAAPPVVLHARHLRRHVWSKLEEAMKDVGLSGDDRTIVRLRAIPLEWNDVCTAFGIHRSTEGGPGLPPDEFNREKKGVRRRFDNAKKLLKGLRKYEYFGFLFGDA